jgi:hypothetical protein
LAKLACGRFADISFVAAGERRDFRRLRLPKLRGDFGGHQLRCLRSGDSGARF